ncbi:MAG: AmmeMemoRadiSam system protein B, partial [Candidatus Izemoplasmatales bacterium]
MSIVAAYALPHPPLIIPEIGRGEERKIRNTIAAYMEVSRRIALLDPDVIVISTPHSVMYQNYIHISPGTKAGGDFGRFGCPDVGFMVDYDSELASLLSAKAIASEIAAGMEGEREKSLDHGVMVPLFFIKKNLQDFKLVRISLSGLSLLDHYRLGRLVQEATEELNRKVVFIGSGDLSHKLKINGPYGFAPEGPAFDKLITDILESGDFDRLLSIDQQLSEKAAECGLRSFAMMAGALDGKDIEKELLSYEGPFGVGYAVMAYAVT